MSKGDHQCSDGSSPILDPRRFRDILRLLCVLGASNIGSLRTEGGLLAQLGRPDSAETWAAVAHETPEFFKLIVKNGGKTFIAANQRRVRGWEKGPLTLDEFTGELLRLAELRDRTIGVGLTLTFNAHLNRIDRYIIDGVIVSVLGRDTTCEIAEFVVEERSGTTKVRLTADSPDQLLAVALVLTDIVPDLDADLVEQRKAVQIWGKRYVADDLRGRWKSTAETLGSIELRIEPEKLEALVEREPGYAAFQGFSSFEPTTWREQAGRMLVPVWNALLDAAANGIPYMLMKSVDPVVRGLLGGTTGEGEDEEKS